MRIEKTERKLYPFDELSEDSQDKAVELLSGLNAGYKWWDSIYEDAATIGLKITEFDIDRGSYCKGDWIEDADNVARLIVKNHGETCKTHKDATAFLTEYEAGKAYDDIAYEFKRTICEDYRIMLQEEYEHLSSKEAIIETIERNGYEFTEDGELA